MSGTSRRSSARAALSLVGALGGMVVPALLYVATTASLGRDRHGGAVAGGAPKVTWVDDSGGATRPRPV